MVRRLLDDLFTLFENRLQDPRVSKMIYNGLVLPIQNEIQDGKLDASIANALARIAQPAIWCIVLIFILLTSLLIVSILLLIRVDGMTRTLT